MVMQGLTYRGDVHLADGFTYQDCVFDHCRVSGNDITIKDSRIFGKISLIECDKVTLENCIATVDEDEEFQEFNPSRIHWVGDMEAEIVDDDGNVTYVKFADARQVARLKDNLYRRN